MPSSSTNAYEFDDWKEKIAADFKRFNALHLELQERPHDPATIQAYEAYKKRREEEREQFKIKFYPSQLQSFGNALPKETKNIGGQSCSAEDSTDEFTTPTFEELPIEYRQAYEEFSKKRAKEFEALRKKQEEEDSKAFNAMLEKDLQDIIKSTPLLDNQVETDRKSVV